MIFKKKKKKKNLYFILGYSQLTMLIVPGEWQRDSAIHLKVSILSQTPLPSRLSYNIGQSSMRHTIGPCWLSILLTAVCVRVQSCPTLCDPMDCSPPDCSVRGIFQAGSLRWVTIFFSSSVYMYMIL